MATRQWITVQKNTFTNWTNDHLKDTGIHVEDLETDLDDGVALIKLLEVLAPGKKMPTRLVDIQDTTFHSINVTPF